MVALVWGVFRVITDFMTLTLFPLLCWLPTGLYIKRHGRVSTVGVFRENAGPLKAAARDWLPPLALLYAYGLLAPIVDHPFFPDRDVQLRSFDRALFFGHDPLLALERIISPSLSEWLAGCYISYVFLFPVVLGAVYMNRDRARFRELALATTLALAVGYIGYTLVPALGPVFTGTFTTKLDLYYFREVKEQLMDRTRIPRDCFPSLHTCMTCVLLWGAWRHARVVFWVLLPSSAFIPFACVYLRYHYVSDVLAGFVLFVIVAVVAPKLQGRYERLYLAQSG
jgi:membrane-associated phospholipid phosphatase